MSGSRRQIITFAGIGFVNTAVDISIFLSLLAVHVPLILANIVSTSAALATSYVLNKRFTFSKQGSSARSLPLFLLVTLTGIWVLQPIIIKLSLIFFTTSLGHQLLTSVLPQPQHYYNLLAKLIATPATLVWNYLWYKKVVFKSSNQAGDMVLESNFYRSHKF